MDWITHKLDFMKFSPFFLSYRIQSITWIMKETNKPTFNRSSLLEESDFEKEIRLANQKKDEPKSSNIKKFHF